MKKRRYALLTLALGIGAVILLVHWRSWREPVYQGKTVSAWVRDANSPDPLARSNAVVALRAMGPTATPFLVQSLNRRDSILKQPLRSLARMLPVWFRRSVVQKLKPFDTFNDRLMAVNALSALGTNAPVLPLVNALRDPERIIATAAAAALGKIGGSAVAELIRASNDSDSQVRSLACDALGNLGANALKGQRGYARLQIAQALARTGRFSERQVPDLLEGLNDKDPLVRGATAQVLGQIGKAAKSAVPALTESLKDENEFVRAGAGEALRKIEPAGAPE